MNSSAATPSTPIAVAGSPLRAPSLRRRMACWLYEGTLMFGVVVLPGLVFGIATNTRHALDNRHALQALLFVVLALYFVYFWVKGQTLPMKTWHIRVVDRHGLPLRWPRALLRYLLAWLWFLPPLAAMAPFRLSGSEVTVLMFGWIAVWALLSRFQREQQFWHDAWAGTRLIDVQPDAARRRQ
ncbi:MAG: RDD family protein [Rubrivivax sp.]|uniref:RDD family protein n=1 Tax=Ottowia sp. TaxID=1898956 RepID=UPI0011DA3159|nr:RDD family protein [Ottowia sp.]MCC6814518.1 RDD family protein [Rubrivivax sp.]MCZ2088850.1 RDD family protein [Burkholderiales bacterium]TXI14521.1 MAG: RDD family protein [Ottowia sp.]HNE59355.1 RDD family protein [Ottowia sp.]HNK53541.1 RDD family protein [Ottowia sp.]